ncbi:hypothetical protein [Aquicella lusitana]|uniref:Uncharacterized protein n=1 Tax=Aquicella lusitana TaxID=254246 RepID=A0A370GPJ5_9COXI|nr:hypothetical protein [Aquicella lusitana]RDI45230.1 hypothetical protein C8D86_107110 [Aquicella lusitana]VVC72700.1 hypothetical protein AQULUS_04200 [Aquicella lusitana]
MLRNKLPTRKLDESFAAPGPIPSIHYVWVGRPSPSDADRKTEIGLEKKGHDREGPEAMAKKNNVNPIYYWCLDDYVSDYKQIFNKNKNIKVFSIQKYVEQYLKMAQKNRDGEAILIAQQMQEIIKFHLKNKERATVRDLVTIKDAFTLFLHVTKDDPQHKTLNGPRYTLDTNVKPREDIQSLSLPYSTKFAYPNLEGSINDCWGIYSPDIKPHIPYQIWKGFFKKWNVAIEYYKTHGHTSKYEELLGLAMVGTMDEVCEDRQNYGETWLWETNYEAIRKKAENEFEQEFGEHAKLTQETSLTNSNTKKEEESTPILVYDLDVEKEYYNTHKRHHLPESVKTPNPKQAKEEVDETTSNKVTPNLATLTPREETFYNALIAAKNYIELHPWVVNYGGKPINVEAREVVVKNNTIKIEGGSKTVPTTIFKQWEIINDALNNYQKGNYRPNSGDLEEGTLQPGTFEVAFNNITSVMVKQLRTSKIYFC